jgi:hypothetical protein
MAISAIASSIVTPQWRSIAAGVLALGVLGGLGSGIYWALGTCRPLDRWLGISGCRERIFVAGFNPLSLRAMFWPQGQQSISLFGTVVKEKRPQPLLIRIGVPGGEEQNRLPLPARNLMNVRTSTDGERAMLRCYGACAEKSEEHVVLISVADAQMIPWAPDSSMPEDWAFYRPFPGEEDAPLSGDEVNLAMGVGGALSPDRKYIAKLLPETGALVAAQGEIVLSDRDDGSVVRSLSFEKRKSMGWYGADNTLLRFSPSGRLLALLDKQPYGPKDAIVHIWDVESGQELASIRTDRSVATDLLWSPDDNSIILNSRIRSNGRRGTAIDIFDWRSKAAPAARASASL